jgi:hypothetical protein
MTGNDGYSAAGAAPKVWEVQAVALYDSKGRIHHMHHVIVFEGVNAADPDTLVREAIAHAERLGRDVRKLKALHVPRVANSRTMHRVDVKTLKLVELPIPTPGPPAVSRPAAKTKTRRGRRT